MKYSPFRQSVRHTEIVKRSEPTHFPYMLVGNEIFFNDINDVLYKKETWTLYLTEQEKNELEK